MADIQPIVDAISPWLTPATVIGVISMVLTGRLRTKGAVDDMRKDMQSSVDVYKDLAKTWKQAYDISEEARRKQENALEELTELSRTSAAVIQALREGPHRDVA